ncbi:MAG: LTA synthase family protein [Campylobacterales bacterium]|nr:LTA synthase family protein [Campylobacterales bacterium]
MSSIKKTLLYVGIILGIFTLARLMLFVSYNDFFSDLTLSQILYSFIHGVRFDLSIALTFLIPAIWFMNLPFKFITSKVAQRIFGWYIFIAIVAYIHILVGNVLYFDHVKRHLADELLLLKGDKTFLFEMVAVYKLETVLGFSFIGILAYFFRRVVDIKVEVNKRGWIIFAGVFVALFLVIRGTVGTKPISLVHAYAGGNSKEASLTLNGVFTAYHYGRRSKKTSFNFYSDEEALKNLGLENKKFPLLKKYDGKKSNYNIVVVMMESWTPKYIDSYSGKSLGITPNFDEIVKNGIKFENFYASGQRSIEGIQSALTGVPPIKGVPNLGFGLEISNVTKLGKMANDNGYETIFMQSSKRGSFYVDSIAKSLGFNKYFGMEDMPPILDYPDKKGAKFGWDYELYMKMFEEIDKTDKPFFGFMFTGTTHTPYPDLPKQFEKYEDNKKIESFYNLMYYSDWSMGQFMEKAKKQKWFDNTIFIFTADHVMAHYQTGGFKDKFKIPFVIYAPKIFTPKVENKITTQLEIMPTIIDLLGFNNDFYSYTDSIFKEREHKAFVNEGGLFGVINDSGYMKHSYGNRLENIGKKESLDTMEKEILSITQVTSKLIKDNRWAK